MNWKQRLFKPKWQHKDADIRLETVSTSDDPLFFQQMLAIAANDADPRVRKAVIKRLHQLENILKLAGTETESSVQVLLQSRIRQLSTSSDKSRPALDIRMQVVELTGDRTLIEQLACHAPEPELRRAALEKVTRQGLLGDRSIEDSDADIRRYAASRITQITTLKRVIKGLRTRDKALHAELQSRLQTTLLGQADPGAVHDEALRICIELEHLVIEVDNRDDSAVEEQHRAWKKVAAVAKAGMKDRYKRICERLAAPPPVEAVVPIIPVTEPEIIETPAEPAKPVVSGPNMSLAQVATDICVYEIDYADRPKAAVIGKLQHKMEKIWQQCKPPHPEDVICWNAANEALQHLQTTLEKQQQQSTKELAQANEQLEQLVLELENGELHKALATRLALQKLNKAKSPASYDAWKSINAKINGMQGRMRELREWQHWSNDKIRNRLIAEMEVLPAADLHPDALLDRVKSLQSEWKRLEKSEQIPGEKHFPASPVMWRKFSSAGNTAFDAAKPFLEKRTEIQSRHAESLAAFCAELEQLITAIPQDLQALGKAMTSGRKKLHDLNSVPAKQRQAFARQLKTALDKANNVMQEHYQAVEREKMKLIRSASQLMHLPERDDAIAQAKSLQSNWKAAGRMWRSKEQELWNQFREHVDPLFEGLKVEQDSIRAADKERLSAQKTLCDELKRILKDDNDLPAQAGIVKGLEDGWKDIEHPDGRLQASFQELLDKYRVRVEQHQQKQTGIARERWWLKSSLLHEILVTGRTAKGAISKKSLIKVQKAWPDNAAESELEKHLDEDYAAILSNGDAGIDVDDAVKLTDEARLLCIRLEFLAGLQSPQEDRELRMQYQVDRLADSMSGEVARRSAADDAHDAESRWLHMYTLPEPVFTDFGKRINLALSAILEG